MKASLGSTVGSASYHSGTGVNLPLLGAAQDTCPVLAQAVFLQGRISLLQGPPGTPPSYLLCLVTLC